MGRYKGWKVCWWGSCETVTSRRLGDDASGDPVFMCDTCYERIAKALTDAANKLRFENARDDGVRH